METLLTWIEGSALGDLVRGAGVWSYGLINLVHILGVATLFGAVLILDLRLLGWRRHIALCTIISLTVPAATSGFALAVLSGLCLLATNASEYIGNPFLLIKFVALPCALLNALLLARTAAWRKGCVHELTDAPAGKLPQGSLDTLDKLETERHEQRVLAMFGAVSLLCWLIVLGAGRMIGYW